MSTNTIMLVVMVGLGFVTGAYVANHTTLLNKIPLIGAA